MIYYTTFENWVDSAVLTNLEIFPNIRCMVWVLPYYPVYMYIDRVKADEIRKEWKNMKANKCEEYCGTCFPLTITVDGRQFVYRYGSAKNRRVGLGMLRTKYPNKKLYPVYACVLLKGGKDDN